MQNVQGLWTLNEMFAMIIDRVSSNTGLTHNPSCQPQRIAGQVPEENNCLGNPELSPLTSDSLLGIHYDHVLPIGLLMAP